MNGFVKQKSYKKARTFLYTLTICFYKIIYYNIKKWGVIMGMTDKQFNSYMCLILDDILKTLTKTEDGKAKEKLQKLADNIQKSIED